MPVANTGGVAVNKKASSIFLDIYGIKRPDFCCAAHYSQWCYQAYDNIKQINIPENTTLYKTLRIIIKNFEATIKNNEILLKILKISKYPKFI